MYRYVSGSRCRSHPSTPPTIVRYSRYARRTSPLAGRLKSSDSARPPGVSTRAISSIASGKIRNVPQAVAGRDQVERSVGKRQRQHVAYNEGARARTLAGAFRRRQLDHPWVMSSPTTRAPDEDSAKAMSPVPVARSSARRPGAGCARATRRRFQRAILAVRKRDRDEIVSIGDRGKEPADVPALAFGRGESIIQGHGRKLDNTAACFRRAPSRTI